MKKKKLILNKGDLFIVTAGDYTARGRLHAVCVAKQDIHIDKLLTEYLDTHPEKKDGSGFANLEFFAFLEQKDLFEEPDKKELYLGDCYERPPEVEITKHFNTTYRKRT